MKKKKIDIVSYNEDGYDKDGYNEDGYNKDGYDINGYNKDGYNSDGYNEDGYNKDGYNKDGYNDDGFNKDGYNSEGYDEDGYDHDGYDEDGYDEDGFKRNGYDSWGYDSDGYDEDGYDEDNCDRHGNSRYDDDDYDEDGYDEDGYSEGTPNYNVINEHDLKPTPIFYQTKNDVENPLYMGFELEVDKGGYSYKVASDVCKMLENKVYCKSDGSLNDGLEIVSYPATMNFHTEQKETYEKVFKYLMDNHYKSHDTTTCGLHIHVNRNFFGSNEKEIDLNIAKILFLFEKYWDNFAKFSRRSEEKLNDWARRYNLDIKKDLIANLERAKDEDERYFAVNLTNRMTIEFRMFKGTLNIDTFIATLQLIDCVCNFVKIIDIDKLQQQACFERIVKSNFKELNEYLQKKNLKLVFFEGEESIKQEEIKIGEEELCV